MNELRREFHRGVFLNILSRRKKENVLTIADKGYKASVDLAERICRIIDLPISNVEISPQKTGSLFANLAKSFLEKSIAALVHLRPATWTFSVAQTRKGIGEYEQFEHLSTLKRILSEHNDLKTDIGGDYLVTPDIVVARQPLADKEINLGSQVINGDTDAAALTPLRLRNREKPKPLLHASISC